MDPSEFHAPEAGQIVTTGDGYPAFVPAPLPPRLSYGPELVLALSRADAALGELSGVGGELPEPLLLDAPFKRQEALCSSRIEGAEMSLSDLLLDQVGAARATVPLGDLREVRACVATLRYGVERLGRAPLSLALVRELHARLLQGEAGGARTPGEFRTTQNWIGPPGSTLATATYVPPPVPEMQAALDAWDRFLQRRGELPDLVQCAMLHQQFEAIHPFVGGNGRLGRLLVTLFLIDRGRLSRPLLYLSAYLEGHRDEYYDLLQRVRTHGEWEAWLLFFANGVRATAERAAVQARALIRVHVRNRELVKGRTLALADELVRTPCMTVPEAQRILDVTNPTARRAVRELEARGLLEEWDEKRWPRIYLARPVLDAVLHPLEVLRSGGGPGVKGAVIKSGAAAAAKPPRRADQLLAEAMALIDTARRAGVLLRLTGGLAVRRHCIDLAFLAREHSDIDLVALSEQDKELREVLTGLGYVENRYVTQSTAGGQLQFIKLEPKDEAGGAALVDHLDVFLDVMRMDHDVDVRGRLAIDDYAISPVDTLIAKLQIGRINQKDVHDVIALLKDLPLHEDDDDLSIDLPYFAEVCAQDWGLYHDVTANLRIVMERLADYGLPEDRATMVYGRLAAVQEAVEDEHKSLRWRLRARVNERVAWRREVEEEEGTPVIAPEWDWRRDLG